jgi:hypothetical protein
MPDVGIDDNEELQEEARELSIKEALALLENKPFTPVRPTLLQKIDAFNKKLLSDTSVFAFKSAAAASVFATLSKSKCRTCSAFLMCPSSLC